MMHPSPDTVLQDVENVLLFSSRLRDPSGLGHRAWPGQDPRTPTPTQKYFAVSNEPEHGASHPSLDSDRGSLHLILRPRGNQTLGVFGKHQSRGTEENLQVISICHHAIKQIAESISRLFAYLSLRDDMAFCRSS